LGLDPHALGDAAQGGDAARDLLRRDRGQRQLRRVLVVEHQLVHGDVRRGVVVGSGGLGRRRLGGGGLDRGRLARRRGGVGGGVGAVVDLSDRAGGQRQGEAQARSGREQPAGQGGRGWSACPEV